MSRVSVKLSWGKSVHITAGPESITCFGFWQGVTIGIVNHLGALYSVHSVDLCTCTKHFIALLGQFGWIAFHGYIQVSKKTQKHTFPRTNNSVPRIFSRMKFYKEWSYTESHSPRAQVTKMTCSLLSQTVRYKTIFFALQKSRS